MKRASDRKGRARGRVRLSGRLRRRPHRLAWIHALVAVVALLVHVGRVAEMLLVEHAVCQHGELAHLSHLHRDLDRQERTQGEGDKATQKTDAREGPALGDEAHDHCDAGTLHHRVGDVGPALVEPSLIPLCDAHSIAERRASSPIGLLHLAPKGSPPPA